MEYAEQTEILGTSSLLSTDIFVYTQNIREYMQMAVRNLRHSKTIT